MKFWLVASILALGSLMGNSLGGQVNRTSLGGDNVGFLEFDFDRSGGDTEESRIVVPEVGIIDLQFSRSLRVARRISVVLRTCGGVGKDAFYSGTRTIAICTETVRWLRRKTVNAGGTDEAEVRRFVRDGIDFIIAHEIAHALVHDARLPVVGDEETAVDELGALLLLDQGDLRLGGGILLMLYLSTDEDASAAAFSHHGASRQRYARLLCTRAGALPFFWAREARLGDPAVTQYLANARERAINALGSSDRVAECEARYPAARQRWARLLSGVWSPRDTAELGYASGR